jgi:hypothetical protein
MAFEASPSPLTVVFPSSLIWCISSGLRHVSLLRLVQQTLPLNRLLDKWEGEVYQLEECVEVTLPVMLPVY